MQSGFWGQRCPDEVTHSFRFLCRHPLAQLWAGHITLQPTCKHSMEAIAEEGEAGAGLCWLRRWTCASRSLLLQPSPSSSIAAIFRTFQHFPLAISWRRFGHASFCLAGVSAGAVTLWSTPISPPRRRQPSTAGPGGYCSADLCQACPNKICYHWPTSLKFMPLTPGYFLVLFSLK